MKTYQERLEYFTGIVLRVLAQHVLATTKQHRAHNNLEREIALDAVNTAVAVLNAIDDHIKTRVE